MEVSVVDIIQLEFHKLKDTPSPHVTVRLDSENSFLWHFVIAGLSGACFGQYEGVIHFSKDFPHVSPIIEFNTPNGRFDMKIPIEVLTGEEWLKHCSIKNLLDQLVLYLELGAPSHIRGSIHTDESTLQVLSTTSLSNVDIPCPPIPSRILPSSESQSLMLGIADFLLKIVPVLYDGPLKKQVPPPVKILDDLTQQKKKDGLIVVRLDVDFSSWEFLKPEAWPNTAPGDPLRGAVSNFLVALLDKLMDFGHSNGRRFMFVKVNLSNTEASMRTMFNGTCAGRPVHREIEVEVLDLTRTKTSPQALGSLFRLRNLRELYLDYCEAFMSKGRDAFSALSKDDQVPNLELLSVVGTSGDLSHKWLSDLQAVCPKLAKVYFTRKKGTKTLGWQDIVLMQTMRVPALLPCGHIGDKTSLKQLGYCSFDRQPFRANELMEINPNISFLSKGQGNNTWKVSIVDYCRNQLDAKTLYHSDCGNFFNLSSIQGIFKIANDNINNELLARLKDLRCPACFKVLESLRICYPHSAEQSSEDQKFESLGSVGNYSVVRHGNQ